MTKILVEKLKKRGLWDNIWAKRRRGEKMRKPGSKGAPTAEALKRSQVKEENSPHLNAKTPSPKQIAQKFKKPVEEIVKAISQGQRVEKEHTTNAKLAREIATDHVNERPDYYTMLKAAEKKKSVKEAFETIEKQSADSNDPSSRFDATKSVVDVYKSDTPGEEKPTKRLRKIKSIVRGNNAK